MEDSAGRDRLAETPFAHVLSGIWRNESTGTLVVDLAGAVRRFEFEAGFLVLSQAGFPGKDFLRFLLTSGSADLIGVARSEEYAQRNGVSTVRALLEAPLFEPVRLWALLDRFAREDAYPLFDSEEGEYEFQPTVSPPGPAYIRDIFLPNLILEGCRRMKNERLMAANLPAENEILQGLSPYFLDLLDLAPHERYVLDGLSGAQTVGHLFAAGDLPDREVRRILFAFLCLGLAGSRPKKPKTGRLASELTLADMDKLLGVLNAKCSYIFKYISKEIGPVALSVVRKSLDDIRGRLDPAFQGLELRADGRIELKAFLKTNLNLAGDDQRRSLLRSMDEILAAEVLAVKRTLGSRHESLLVRSLERIGEPS